MEKREIEWLKEKAMEVNEQLIQVSDAVAKEKQYHVTRCQGQYLGYMDFVISLCDDMLSGSVTMSDAMFSRMEDMVKDARAFVVNHEK